MTALADIEPVEESPAQEAPPPPPPSRARRIVRRMARGILWLVLGFVAFTSIAMIGGVLLTRVDHPAGSPIINDVTQLNPIAVGTVLTPTSIEDIVAAVRYNRGPISVGGGRYSMGGQTASRGGIQLDLRRFNKVLAFDPAAKTITVQTGIRWRDIQERIDSADLSVKIMQTYANFTVGGSLSVNVHGRYVGLGPLILSVRSITVVLADGSVVVATPTENSEVFYGAIGGYGGIGVIVEATLDLADNVRVRRVARKMPIGEYRQYFVDKVRSDSTAVFHNADLYPDEYQTVNAITYERTTDSVTIADRLIPSDRDYGLNRTVFRVITGSSLGKAFREKMVDPIIFRNEPVTWRNYEASYDVAELEPSSRERSTYVLQEYFVPIGRFDEFVPQMANILRRHRVNVVNVSIRHANPDPGAMLAWAKSEVFAFVLYYKQDTDEASRRSVGPWTRELVDAAVKLGGSYYLPYQPHATLDQFLEAYPRAWEFFALKTRLDSTAKFRNTLWDRYYLAYSGAVPPPLEPTTRDSLATVPGYARDEGQTYLSHPEWYIVYSSEEYARYLGTNLPTGFPYFASIGQFWANYREVNKLTSGRYPTNTGYHVMLMVIGSSYSAELALKSLYENTIGRVTGWTTGGALSAEDRFAHQVHTEYGTFIHVRPWYEFRFWPKVKALWTDLPAGGPYPIRKWERKLFLSAEFGIKALYASLIESATRAAYAPEDDAMRMVVTGLTDSTAAPLRRIASLDGIHSLVSTGRYDAFRDAMLTIARTHSMVTIDEIAGNDEILVTGVAPTSWTSPLPEAPAVYSMRLPSDSSQVRTAVRVPVNRLLAFLRAPGSLAVDHIYDY